MENPILSVRELLLIVATGFAMGAVLFVCKKLRVNNLIPSVIAGLLCFTMMLLTFYFAFSSVDVIAVVVALIVGALITFGTYVAATAADKILKQDR